VKSYALVSARLGHRAHHSYGTRQPILTRGSLRPVCVVGYLMGEGWVHT